MRKWLLIILLILAALAGTGYYFYNKYIAQDKWKPLLQAKLKELILKSSDSLYHIEYSDFDLNIASGNVTLGDFKLMPDTVIYKKLVALKKAPDNLFILGVKKLSIKNIGARKAYDEKILNIDNISIENPSLTVINKRFDYNDTVKVGKAKSPYQLIKSVFKQLKIDSILLKDISVSYINKNNAAAKKTSLKHLDIIIHNVTVDSLSDNDPNRFYYTRGVEVILHDYAVQTPDGLYNAKIKTLYFSTALKRIVLDKVSFLPKYDKDEFYKQTGEAGDIFSLRFKRIDIKKIDLQRFLRDQKLYAGSMDVKNADVDIYNNNAYHGRKRSKIGKDPHQELQKVALDMDLKRLNIINSNITYSEADETSGKTGVITFNKTSGYFLNVTNDAAAKRRNQYMKAVINTSFMNSAALNVNFKFNLTAKDGAFNYSGTLDKFDGRILDKLVKPLALVHVESADIDKLAFDIDASNYAGKGHVDFFYKNLNIQLLKKVEGQDELQKQGLISKLANTLIIEKSNPDKKGNFRPGPVNLQREPTMSFFSFLYTGILDGLKPSVGFDKKTEGKVNKVVTKVSNLMDKYQQFKDKRKERREERKQKRQEKKEAKEQKKLQEQQADSTKKQ